MHADRVIPDSAVTAVGPHPVTTIAQHLDNVIEVYATIWGLAAEEHDARVAEYNYEPFRPQFTGLQRALDPIIDALHDEVSA